MKQQGFAHAVLIIVLVVALLGALGYIFWQNFIKEEPSTQESNTKIARLTENTNDEVASEPKNESDPLKIDEWQIQIPNAEAYRVAKSTQSDNPDGSDAYVIYKVSTYEISKETKTLGCPEDDIGYIVRLKTVMNGDPRVRTEKINGYYYLFAPRSQAACAGANGQPPERLNKLMETAMNEFNDLFKHTVAQN